MKSVVFVDIQNVFYGLKRITGDQRARCDFVKLRNVLSSSEDDLFLAYIVTPVMGADSPRPHVMKDDAWFIHFLRKSGYQVRRHFARVFQSKDDDSVQFDRTSPVREMVIDSLRHIHSFDRVVIVSGSGATIPLADKAHELGKLVVVASFERAGDLNPGLKARADETVQLDASFQYVPRRQRNRHV